MKTPEEIKHGMECCKNIGSCIIGNCEYFSGYPICTRDLIRDALEYINELEVKAPRYPTWREWQKSMFPDGHKHITPCTFGSRDRFKCWGKTCYVCMEQQIPADIAEKLGIKPIEEVVHEQ